MSAFARAAPAGVGDTSQTAALPSCPCADQASNFNFTAEPKGEEEEEEEFFNHCL